MADKRKKAGSGLLYRVTGPGLSAPSYLFGTMHTRDARVHAFLPGLMPYLRECEVLCTEFPLDQEELPSFLQSGEPLNWWNGLSKGKRRMLARLMEKQGLGDPQAFSLLPPLVLIQVLTAQLLGDEEEHPLDLALAHSAATMGLRREGVETFEEQLDTLQKLTIKAQRKHLLDIAGNYSKFRRQLHKQVKWYVAQDIRQLHKDGRRQLKKMRKTLLTDRNLVMAERMDSRMRSAPHFFAIGAGHLAGGKGLLRLLKHRGFRLETLPLKTTP